MKPPSPGLVLVIALILGWFSISIFWAVVFGLSFIVGKSPVARSEAEVTWYHTSRTMSVAVNPRTPAPDGTLYLVVNEGVVPNAAVVVKKWGHMKPGASADYDLSPDAFRALAPLADGRIRVRVRQVYP